MQVKQKLNFYGVSEVMIRAQLQCSCHALFSYIMLTLLRFWTWQMPGQSSFVNLDELFYLSPKLFLLIVLYNNLNAVFDTLFIRNCCDYPSR